MSFIKDDFPAVHRPLFAMMALGASCFSCTTDDDTTADAAVVSLDAGQKPDPELDSSTPRADDDASVPSASKPDASGPDTKTPDASGPDGAPDASDSVLKCPELKTHGCDFGLGCGNYESKSAEVAASCDAEWPNKNYYAGEGCDQLILVHNFGAGDSETAFYDPESGALTAMVTYSDTGEKECAGPVPVGCLQDIGVVGETHDYCAALRPDSSIPAHDDAGTHDDAGGPDAQAPGCVKDTVTFGYNGGLVAWVDTVTLSPCANFSINRVIFGDPGSTASCSSTVASDAAFNAADVQDALEHPDVVAAFAAAPVLYGHDSRPVDGTVYRVELGGKAIEIGTPCLGRQSCTAIPSGVAALGILLQAVDTQQRALPGCQISQ